MRQPESLAGPGGHENALGPAIITIDPSDSASAGQHQLGPTRTDNDNVGYLVNLSVDILSATPQPDMSVVGIEVTQAIQHFHSVLGEDNTVPLVAGKPTLVRAYLDSGVDPSINGGKVPGVTGEPAGAAQVDMGQSCASTRRKSTGPARTTSRKCTKTRP